MAIDWNDAFRGLDLPTVVLTIVLLMGVGAHFAGMYLVAVSLYLPVIIANLHDAFTE